MESREKAAAAIAEREIDSRSSGGRGVSGKQNRTRGSDADGEWKDDETEGGRRRQAKISSQTAGERNKGGRLQGCEMSHTAGCIAYCTFLTNSRETRTKKEFHREIGSSVIHSFLRFNPLRNPLGDVSNFSPEFRENGILSSYLSCIIFFSIKLIVVEKNVLHSRNGNRN